MIAQWINIYNFILVLTERNLHVLQTQIVERDHPHKHQRQWQHIHAFLQLVADDRKVVENGLGTIVTCDLAQVAQDNADYAS